MSEGAEDAGSETGPVLVLSEGELPVGAVSLLATGPGAGPMSPFGGNLSLTPISGGWLDMGDVLPGVGSATTPLLSVGTFPPSP